MEPSNNSYMASLYVGDLAPEVNESTLMGIFSSYGEVIGIKICKNVTTGVSLCYAYVNYRTKGEAELAIKMTNYTKIYGKECRVMWSMRDPKKRKINVGNLFVKNIDPDLDSRALYEAFSAFGNVATCKVAQDEYGSSKGFGFVQYYEEAHSIEAISKVNGVLFRGKKIYASKFIPRQARTNATKVDPNKFTNVFIKNFGEEWQTEDLNSHFSPFGEITSSVVQRDNDKKSLGYGFVNYQSVDCAVKAIEKMDGFVVKDDKKLYVARAMKKTDRIAYFRKRKELRKKEMHDKYRLQNLYVKNFDESYTDEKLREDFSKFGEIRSSKIMRDENNKSKCFGFVCFNTDEEAAAAVKDMNNKAVDGGKYIYVAIAQSKEERRNELASQRFGPSGRAYSLNFPTPYPYMYPQPAMMPFPQHFHQQFNHRSAGPRINGGRVMISSQPMNFNMQPATGYPHGYSQNGSFPPQYMRYRNPQLNNQGYRSERYLNQSSMTRHPNSSSGQQRQYATQVSTNQVASNTQQKHKREEKQAQETVEDITSSDYADKIFHACQQVLSSNKLEDSIAGKVSGVILDSIRSKKITAPSNMELTNLVMKCYEGLVKSS